MLGNEAIFLVISITSNKDQTRDDLTSSLAEKYKQIKFQQPAITNLNQSGAEQPGMFTVPTPQHWGCASPQTKTFEWIDSPAWCSCTVLDQQRVMPAAALGSNGKSWQPNGKVKQSLELRAFPADKNNYLLG